MQDIDLKPAFEKIQTAARIDGAEVELPGQPQRRATEAAADVEDAGAARHRRPTRQPGHELHLGGLGRLVGLPVTVVDVVAPEGAVEDGEAVVL